MNKLRNAFILQLACFAMGIIMMISGAHTRTDTWFAASIVIGANIVLHSPKENE